MLWTQKKKKKIKHTKANFGFKNIKRNWFERAWPKYSTLYLFTLYTNYKSDIIKNEILAEEKTKNVTFNIDIRALNQKL